MKLHRNGIRDVLKGIFLGFFGFAAHSTADAFVKFSGNGANVYVIGFFLTLFSTIPWIASSRKGEQWRKVFAAKRPLLVHMRAWSSVCASILAIYAFTNLPIAEAYALIFLVPFSITVFSVILLGEKVHWQRWLLLGIGFAGIMLVIRPGFREVNLAHFAGLGIAFFAGISVTLTRRLAPTESNMTLMGVLFFWMLFFYSVMMLPGFEMPTGRTMLALFAGGLCSGMGHLLILRALSLAPANRVGAIQYTQIVWAVTLGVVFFGEFPDLATYAGLGIVAMTGLFSFIGGDAGDRSAELRKVEAQQLR